jgi:hypothetical protein
MQRSHQEFTGAARAVPGEHPAGSVRTMGGGRQADKEHPGARITEAGDGPRPVHLIAVRGLSLACDTGAIRAKARAFFAGDDVSLNRGEGMGLHEPDAAA